METTTVVLVVLTALVGGASIAAALPAIGQYLARRYGPSQQSIAGSTRRRSSAEKRARRHESFIAGLKRTDPAKYRELMERELGLSRDGLEQFIELRERIAAAGMDPAAQTSWMRDAAQMAAALGPSLLQMVGGAQVRPLGVPVPGAHPAPSPPPPAIGPPRPGRLRRLSAAPAPGALPSAATIEAPSGDSEAPPSWPILPAPSPEAGVAPDLVGHLAGTTPRQGAVWLAAHPSPTVQQLVAAIRATPDDQMAALFDQVCAAAPHLRPTFDWLLAHDDWLRLTAAELRSPGSVATETGADAVAPVSGPRSDMGL